MIASFGFLGLVDDDARSTDDLRTLVRACGADDWPATLADILRRAYSSLFVGSLADMTPGQFDEKFAAIYSGKEEVRKKCVRFFLSAAEDAKVGVNLRIARRLRPHKNVPDRRTVRRLERPRASVYPKNPSRNWSEGLGDEVDGRRAAIFGDLVADLDALTDVQKTAFMTMLQYFKRLDKTAREA
jgi:hypothetical protein